MMEIRCERRGKKGIIIAEENGAKIGELDYHDSAPGEMTIYHTEVDEKFRGGGVGRDLVEAAVKHAQHNKLRIIPKCAYAAKVINDTPEFQDVLIT
jgi:uncharacterized protein